MRDADVLEHADRDDAVVFRRLQAIVEQLEAHAVGQAAFECAAARDSELFLRQGDTGHVDAELAAQEQGHATPTGADVEQRLAGLQQKLGGDMALLLLLRLLERLLAGPEVGAGILPVAIEEEIVELVVEVVVVRDVALRLANRIVLLEGPHQPLPLVGHADDECFIERGDVTADQVHQVVDVGAVLDGQLAVHVGFAEGKPRADRQADAGPPGLDFHGHGRAWPRTLDDMRLSRRIDHCQLAFANYAG